MSKEGTVAEYGMLAKDNIEEGEVLFTIPRSALLHQGTTKVSALLEKGSCYNYKEVFHKIETACIIPLSVTPLFLPFSFTEK